MSSVSEFHEAWRRAILTQGAEVADTLVTIKAYPCDPQPTIVFLTKNQLSAVMDADGALLPARTIRNNLHLPEKFADPSGMVVEIYRNVQPITFG